MPVRFATLNLHHFAAPGLGWRGAPLGHDDETWAAKCAWLTGVLQEVDADVIGFQEVASVDVLADLLATAGYAHVAAVDEPELDPPAAPDGPPLYRRSVNVIASRFPMWWEAPEPRHGLAPAVSLREARSFRRPPVRATVETSELGEVVVYCAHFRSPGVSIGDSMISGEPAPEGVSDQARAGLEALSRSHVGATIQRLFEATALYHDVAEQVSDAPDRPVVVLGDLNDTPETPVLRALTPHRLCPDPETGGDAAARWRLVDAARLSPRMLLSDRRKPTNFSRFGALTLDYILVSGALCPELLGDAAAGRLVAFEVHDGHLSAWPRELSSDHAAVSATFAALEP